MFTNIKKTITVLSSTFHSFTIPYKN